MTGFNALWSIGTWYKITQSLFNPYIFLFFSTILFNSGQILLEIFGLNINGILNNQFPKNIILESAFITLIGVEGLHLGALYSNLNQHKRKRLIINNNYDYESMKLVGLFLFIISIIPTLLIMRENLNLVMSGGYLKIYQQNSSTGFEATPQVLSSLIVPSAMLLLAIPHKLRMTSYAMIFMLSIYSLINLFLGSRYVAIAPLIALAWIWDTCRGKLSRKVIFSGLLILVVFLPLWGSIRTLPGENRTSFQTMLTTFHSMDSPSVALISEMGNTLQTTAYTLELVPQVRSYDYGMGYIYALTTLFPNIWGGVHPGAKGLSSWLVQTVSPLTAAAGGGLGYSFIAEAYINFGTIGVIIVLFGIGYLFNKLVIWAINSNDPARYGVIGSLLTYILFLPRSEFIALIRPLVWYPLLPYILILLLRKQKNNYKMLINGNGLIK